eukprot:8509707-Alexandrium_andersonii.AAC.1
MAYVAQSFSVARMGPCLEVALVRYDGCAKCQIGMDTVSHAHFPAVKRGVPVRLRIVARKAVVDVPPLPAVLKLQAEGRQASEFPTYKHLFTARKHAVRRPPACSPARSSWQEFLGTRRYSSIAWESTA